MKLAVIGDYNKENVTHISTSNALIHSIKFLNAGLDFEWVPTETILQNFAEISATYDAYLIGPGSPYKDMDGVMEIIKFARENKIPALGTCGGFQHMVIEFARNVADVKDAEHAETNPYASKLVIEPLSCSLYGQKLEIDLIDKNSIIYNACKQDVLVEQYYCNFGLNPEYQEIINNLGFKIVASDNLKEVRALELSNHPFFIATLFIPQQSSTEETPHPIITRFIEAILDRKNG